MLAAKTKTEPPPPPPPPLHFTYRECLKNHAVNIGGHAVDGCSEFTHTGPESTLDSLKCAACNCHRNFHRKEPVASLIFHPQFPPRGTMDYIHVAAPQRMLALPSPTTKPRISTEHYKSDDVADVPAGTTRRRSSSYKRYRTKFTEEQEEKMLGLAERLGWRIRRHDEEVVEKFCSENGVKRQVFKVWMYNNKHSFAKKTYHHS